MINFQAQSVFILLCRLSLLDFGLNGGKDDTFYFFYWIFEDGNNYWFEFTFWAYCLLITGILQTVKAVNND